MSRIFRKRNLDRSVQKGAIVADYTLLRNFYRNFFHGFFRILLSLLVDQGSFFYDPGKAVFICYSFQSQVRHFCSFHWLSGLYVNYLKNFLSRIFYLDQTGSSFGFPESSHLFVFPSVLFTADMSVFDQVHLVPFLMLAQRDVLVSAACAFVQINKMLHGDEICCATQ